MPPPFFFPHQCMISFKRSNQYLEPEAECLVIVKSDARSWALSFHIYDIPHNAILSFPSNAVTIDIAQPHI